MKKIAMIIATMMVSAGAMAAEPAKKEEVKPATPTVTAAPAAKVEAKKEAVAAKVEAKKEAKKEAVAAKVEAKKEAKKEESKPATK